jgi:hypothetical protein
MFQLTIISVLILGEVLELLSRARKVVHPKESLLLGIISVPVSKILLIIPVLPGIQGDCKENGLERGQLQNGGQMPCFSAAVS